MLHGDAKDQRHTMVRTGLPGMRAVDRGKAETVGRVRLKPNDLTDPRSAVLSRSAGLCGDVLWLVTPVSSCVALSRDTWRSAISVGENVGVILLS